MPPRAARDRRQDSGRALRASRRRGSARSQRSHCRTISSSTSPIQSCRPIQRSSSKARASGRSRSRLARSRDRLERSAVLLLEEPHASAPRCTWRGAGSLAASGRGRRRTGRPQRRETSSIHAGSDERDLVAVGLAGRGSRAESLRRGPSRRGNRARYRSRNGAVRAVSSDALALVVEVVDAVAREPRALHAGLVGSLAAERRGPGNAAARRAVRRPPRVPCCLKEAKSNARG